MEKLISELSQLKTDIQDLQSDKSIDDLHKILEMKDLPLDVLETLILLHSNTKSELHSIRFFQIRSLSKIADKMEKMAILLDNRIDMNEKALQDFKINNIWFNRMVKTIFIMGGFIIFLFVLFSINPDAARWSAEFVKSVSPVSQDAYPVPHK